MSCNCNCMELHEQLHLLWELSTAALLACRWTEPRTRCSRACASSELLQVTCRTSGVSSPRCRDDVDSSGALRCSFADGDPLGPSGVDVVGVKRSAGCRYERYDGRASSSRSSSAGSMRFQSVREAEAPIAPCNAFGLEPVKPHSRSHAVMLLSSPEQWRLLDHIHEMELQGWNALRGPTELLGSHQRATAEDRDAKRVIMK